MTTRAWAYSSSSASICCCSSAGSRPAARRGRRCLAGCVELVGELLAARFDGGVEGDGHVAGGAGCALRGSELVGEGHEVPISSPIRCDPADADGGASRPGVGYEASSGTFRLAIACGYITCVRVNFAFAAYGSFASGRT